MRLPCLVAVPAVVVLVGCQPGPDALDWDAVQTLIASDFPDLPSLTTAELAARLEEESDDIILLDAREEEEFAVSHLPGAHHVASDADAASRLAEASRDALVVAYCAVGYRSAALVAELIDRGHTNTVNLEGSIFRWASEGRPVYRGNTQVRVVHPYDDSWGALLPSDLWAYAPASPQ